MYLIRSSFNEKLPKLNMEDVSLHTRRQTHARKQMPELATSVHHLTHTTNFSQKLK